MSSAAHLGYDAPIIAAVRLFPQCNLVIRWKQIEAIERHSANSFTRNYVRTYDLSTAPSAKKAGRIISLFPLENVMPITLADLRFATSLQDMSAEDFLLTWHAEIEADNEQRIRLVESVATRRFGLSTWHHRYARRFPGQMRYRLPPRK